MKVTIVLTPANHAYLKGQEGSLSDTINDVLQAHRTFGPIHDRIQRQADRLDKAGLELLCANLPPFVDRPTFFQGAHHE